MARRRAASLLLVSLSLLPSPADAAGWCTGIERGEGCGATHEDMSAQELHLAPGEQPRSEDQLWGAGLIEETIQADVFVAGGGSAGTSAALAAARSGAKTVLVHGRPVLGGNSGSEVKLSMVGACGPRAGSGNDNALKMDCREGGIVEEYQLDNAINNPNLVPELFSLELLTLIKAEPNLILFLNTWLVGANTTGGQGLKRIVSAVCENQDSQRRFIVKAKSYIDTTGDGRLGAEAGAEWVQGREARSQYNESIAPLVADHETEGTSIDFQAKDYGHPVTFRPPFWAAKFNKSQFQYRGVSGTRPYGYWWNEISWPYNTITDGENVTQEGISDILGLWDYIKNSGDHPESANMGLTWVQNVGCKREGRRFVGQYVQTQNDIMREPNAKPAQVPDMYWDRVSYAGWSFDLHNPKGMRDPSHPPFTSFTTPYMFSTPLRSLVAKDVSNLFFAGRLGSFSHVVYGSQRVMKTCASMGQAVGTAAAYASAHGLEPAELKDHPEAVWSIQQQLLRDDAFIIGLNNTDPRDYARTATVSASSEAASGDGAARNVISGQSRASVAQHGVGPLQGIPGSNRWISGTAGEHPTNSTLPATLTLVLAEPKPIAQVQLVFDTGMNRKLAFSVVFRTNNPTSEWGPQRETVRDYLIEGKDPATGEWQLLCNVSGNYQRRRVHTLPCPAPSGPAPIPPAPPPAVIAPGAVEATLCNPTSTEQKWSIEGDGTVRAHNVAGHELCLSYSSSTAGFGGHGQAVIALPCTANSTKWEWAASSQGSFLKVARPANEPLTCLKKLGPTTQHCECVHAVGCAACHTTTTGGSAYIPPTSVELYTCTEAATHILWSKLILDAGPSPKGATSGLLMADGLCLAVSQKSTKLANVPAAAAAMAPTQRVQMKPPALSSIAPAKSVSAVRVVVTGTNGIEEARINEVRLYDSAGLAPFPAKPAE